MDCVRDIEEIDQILKVVQRQGVKEALREVRCRLLDRFKEAFSEKYKLNEIIMGRKDQLKLQDYMSDPEPPRNVDKFTKSLNSMTGFLEFLPVKT